LQFTPPASWVLLLARRYQPRLQIRPKPSLRVVRLGGLLEFEIEMVVVATSGIELLAAIWTRIPAPHVLMDGELSAAGTAKDCFLGPFTLRPHFDRVTGERCVAIMAGVIDRAAFHLDGDDVGGAAPMSATGLRIEIDATHLWKI